MEGEIRYRGYVLWFDGAMWVAELKTPHLDVVEEMGSRSFDNLVRMIDQLDACAAVSTFDSVKLPNWYQAWLDAGQKGRIMDPFAKVTTKFFVKAGDITAVQETKKPRNFEVPGVDGEILSGSRDHNQAKEVAKKYEPVVIPELDASVIAANVKAMTSTPEQIRRIEESTFFANAVRFVDIDSKRISDRIAANSIDVSSIMWKHPDGISPGEAIKRGMISIPPHTVGKALAAGSMIAAGGAIVSAAAIIGPGATMNIGAVAGGIAASIYGLNGLRSPRIAPPEG